MNTVTDVDRGMTAFAARLGKHATVRVGILSDAPKQHDARAVVEGKRAGKKSHTAVTFDGGSHAATLLEIAVIHEFGAPAANIPQRSFIRATIDENLPRIHAAQVALAKQIILAEITPAQAMARLGAMVAGMMKARIARGIEPPNSPKTIEAKGSSKPLVDTGQLRSSITFVVEESST